MKKIVIMIVILLSMSAIILGISFAKSKMNKEYELIEFDSSIIDLVDNKGVSDINYNNIKITNIYFDNKVLNFYLIGNKEEIMDKTLNIVLYNDFASSPGNVTNYIMSNLNDEIIELENGYSLKLDLKDIYNNPYRIGIEVK